MYAAQHVLDGNLKAINVSMCHAQYVPGRYTAWKQCIFSLIRCNTTLLMSHYNVVDILLRCLLCYLAHCPFCCAGIWLTFFVQD